MRLSGAAEFELDRVEAAVESCAKRLANCASADGGYRTGSPSIEENGLFSPAKDVIVGCRPEGPLKESGSFSDDGRGT